MRLRWTYHCDRFKICKALCDLDHIFKAIDLYVGYLEPMDGFSPKLHRFTTRASLRAD